ncbi:MAG: type II CAAX endopeptidase family protein [Anaerococcus sp.]|nr:type II CAAX endopeptidase family protein [Anaerococcus sp.]
MKYIKSLAFTLGFILALSLFQLLVAGVLTRFVTRSIGLILLGQYALQALILYLIIQKRTKTYKEVHEKAYIYNRPLDQNSYKAFIIGLGFAGFGVILINLILSLFGQSSLVTDSIEFIEGVFASNGFLDQIFLFIAAVLVGPIIEEFTLRGIYFGEVKRYLSIRASIFLTAFTFALIHLNLVQGINAFFLGLGLAYVYYYRRSIKEAILVHIANNLVAFSGDLGNFIGTFILIISFISMVLAIKYLIAMRRDPLTY